MEFDVDKVFPNLALGELKEDEYADKDGYPYCKKCKTKRYSKFTTSEGKVWLMRCMCDCQSKEAKEREEEEKKEKRLEEFKERQKLSMLGRRYLDVRFESATITKHNKDAFEKCKNYAKNSGEVIKNNAGLYIYGDNSSGKTYLTACLCNELVSLGYRCLYTNIPTLLSEIQKSYNDSSGLSESKVIQLVEYKDFLFIDDLGKEFLGREFNASTAKFAEKILLEILNCRYNNGRPTIFSSNYSISELAEAFHLDKAIIERINEMSTRVIKLEGDNFRDSELKNKSELLKKLGI